MKCQPYTKSFSKFSHDKIVNSSTKRLNTNVFKYNSDSSRTSHSGNFNYCNCKLNIIELKLVDKCYTINPGKKITGDIPILLGLSMLIFLLQQNVYLFTLIQGSTVFLMRSPTICSNLALVSFMFICLGPKQINVLVKFLPAQLLALYLPMILI